MQADNYSDSGNAAESTIIGLVVTFFVNYFLPWAIHTAAAIITGVIVAYCVYRFNKFIRK
jgi:hypothetical protein